MRLPDSSRWKIAATRRHFWSSLHRDLPILRAATGADADWMGAAAKAAQQFPQPLNIIKQS